MWGEHSRAQSFPMYIISAVLLFIMSNHARLIISPIVIMCAIAGVACMPLCVFVCVYPRVRVTETIPSLDHLIKAGERKKKKFPERKLFPSNSRRSGTRRTLPRATWSWWVGLNEGPCRFQTTGTSNWKAIKTGQRGQVRLCRERGACDSNYKLRDGKGHLVRFACWQDGRARGALRGAGRGRRKKSRGKVVDGGLGGVGGCAGGFEQSRGRGKARNDRSRRGDTSNANSSWHHRNSPLIRHTVDCFLASRLH